MCVYIYIYIETIERTVNDNPSACKRPRWAILLSSSTRLFRRCLRHSDITNYIYIYICISISLSLYMYIYTYTYIHLSLSLYIYIYILRCRYTHTIIVYVYTYIHRFRRQQQDCDPVSSACTCNVSTAHLPTCLEALIILHHSKYIYIYIYA